MTALDVRSGEDVRRLRRSARIISFVASGIVISTCVAIIVFYAVFASIPSVVLIGDLTGFQVAYFSGVVGLVALASLILLAPAPRWWLYLAVPASAVSLASAILLGVMGGPFVVDTKVTPLFAEGCAIGYIAIEPSGGGSFIGVRDGWRVLRVQQVAGDDFSRPFATGDYEAHVHDGEIAVWHDGVSASPAFRLPQLPNHTCE